MEKFESENALEAESEPGCRLPLAGRTIIVTRSREQAGKIIEMLEGLGAKVVSCPTIETVAPDSWDALDAAIKQLESYDWLVFTSANGARFFFHRLKEAGGKNEEAITKLTVCAIGPATARAIEEAGTHVDLIAKESVAEGALRAIIERVGGEEKIRGLRFLIPRARIARNVLPDELGKLGAHVDAVEAYETIKPDVDVDAMIRLFEEDRVDAITFTSPSTVSNFAAMIGADNIPNLLENTLVACIGPVTTKAAQEHKLKMIIQPEIYNAAALVEAIVKSLANQ
ncbi:MAG TPA: uroporphyrinogen-III synthase [Blastocatellia bacterium]|nr:uroporphyrinogen-III synthase [Blastocatellia bacterium]